MSEPRDLAPVAYRRGEREEPPPAAGLGLCLSGGGYRAMLFHAGALWRLNEARLLPRLDVVSSVSGGSITAGALAMAWDRLDFEGGVARNLEAEMVAPLRRLAGVTLDVRAVLGGLLLPGATANRLARGYRRRLFGATALGDLPERPAFVLNAANLQTGALWRFSREAVADHRVGRLEWPEAALATAVAASSAFPPFLSPLRLRPPAELRPTDGADLAVAPYSTRPVLSDGGVYDNLGLEQPWKRCRTVLISDAGGELRPAGRVASFWPVQLPRVVAVIDNQVRTLRKRQAVAGYVAGIREGAYWGIRSDPEHYPVESPLPCPPRARNELASIRTRLARLDAATQERLVNWGYAIADVALRAWVVRDLAPPGSFPYPLRRLDAQPATA